MDAGVIPMHPEAVPGDPSTVRWVLAPEAVPVQGEVAVVPGALGELCAAGVVRRVAGLPGAVVVTLGAGRSWRSPDGAAVRTALHEALTRPDEWRLASGDDPALARAVEAVLAGPAAEVVQRHGGSVRVAAVTDGTVTLEVGGACAGCPAAGLTIGTTLESAIREAVPGVREVVVTEVARPRFVALGNLMRGGGRDAGG